MTSFITNHWIISPIIIEFFGALLFLRVWLTRGEKKTSVEGTILIKGWAETNDPWYNFETAAVVSLFWIFPTVIIAFRELLTLIFTVYVGIFKLIVPKNLTKPPIVDKYITAGTQETDSITTALNDVAK